MDFIIQRIPRIDREILRLAIPNILSTISVPLLSTVDTALMGRLSELHLGAVGLGAMIFNFIYWNFGFLRMGTTGITAQAFGRKEHQEQIDTLARGLFIALCIAAIVLVLQSPFADASIFLLNVNVDQTPLVLAYFDIRIWAAPATMLLYVIFGWFFGQQNAVYPLILTLIINVINIVCSYIFVRYLHWGVEGVAYGTLIAQYVGLVAGGIMIRYRYPELVRKFTLKALRALHQFKRFLQVNADIFIRTLSLTFAFGFFYSMSAEEGDLILAANVILIQYLHWMSYGVDGFAYAAESLVGKYYGAKNEQRLSLAIHHSFYWGMGLAVFYGLTYGGLGDYLLAVFTNQADVMSTARPFLFWMAVLPIVGSPCYIWDGIYIGLTASKAMRNSMLAALVIYLLAYWLIGDHWNNHGLWLALLIFLGARGLIQTVLYQWKGSSLK